MSPASIKYFCGVASALGLFFTSGVAAGGEWAVTTAAFRTAEMKVQSVDQEALAIADDDVRSHSIPLDSMIEMRRIQLPDESAMNAGVRPGNDSTLAVCTSQGERIFGHPVDLKGDNLRWSTATLGTLTLPMRVVRSIGRGTSATYAAPTTAPTEDTLRLENGDSLSGIVGAVDPDHIVLQRAGGDSIDVPLGSVRRMVFAAPGGPGESLKYRQFLVGLIDGSRVISRQFLLKDETAKLSVGGSESSVSADQIVSVEQLNGPVIWLSSLVPAESFQQSLGSIAWPAQMDATVDGQPLRAGNQTYAHGVGVHANSRLTFAVPAGMKQFRTLVAAGASLPYADLHVTVLLDAKPVFEAHHLRSETAPQSVAFPLASAKALTLQVDDETGLGIQARLNWLEAAFVRGTEPVESPPMHE